MKRDTMEVSINTPNLSIKLKNGKITFFELKGKQDLGELRGYMNRLTRTIDDMTMAMVSVEHINHAASLNNYTELKGRLRMVEDEMTLHCSCSDCLLSYFRSCINTDKIPTNLLRDTAPILAQDIDTDLHVMS